MKMTSPQPGQTMRLQKYLARCGVASRRACEELIVAGRVQVNGAVVTKLGTKVACGTDTICFDGEPVVWRNRAPVVLMLNKPAGYVTSMSDPQGRPCVSQLIPCEAYPGIFPVGRLDFDTRGLLLFTDDGELGNALLHPSNHVPKTYEALVRGVPTEENLAALRRGIMLDDGPTQPAEVAPLERHNNQVLLEITLHEGRKRQVKRMCAGIDHPVISLRRTSFGPLSLGGLPLGQWRLLDADEVCALSPKS